jgi:hypothetical protein
VEKHTSGVDHLAGHQYLNPYETYVGIDIFGLFSAFFLSAQKQNQAGKDENGHGNGQRFSRRKVLL